jgi:glycosyltransferase involved in cell wall biosynthesis
VLSQSRRNSTQIAAAPNKHLRILVLTDFFVPSPGGGYRTITNLVSPLASSVTFSFLSTPSNDARDGSLPGMTHHDWRKEGDHFVQRVPWRNRSISQIDRAVKSEQPELIVSTSLMSTFTPLLLMWRLLRSLTRPAPPILLMPQGELMDGALAIKSKKKALYLWMLRVSRLTQNVHWWATTEDERLAIRDLFPDASIHLVQTPPTNVEAARQPMPDRAGGFRILFASSVNAKKRPSVLIEALIGALDGHPTPTLLTICGSAHDRDEQQRCAALIKLAPICLQFENLGPVEPGKVIDQIKACHILALPTLGESFGHVILEALANSRPVLTGRRTPWTDILDSGAGEAVDEPVEAWTAALSRWLAFDQFQLQERSDRAFTAASEFLSKSEVPASALLLFENLALRND